MYWATDWRTWRGQRTVCNVFARVHSGTGVADTGVCSVLIDWRTGKGPVHGGVYVRLCSKWIRGALGVL